MTLGTVRGCRPGKTVALLESEITALCLNCREAFMEEPMLLDLPAPIMIFGDIHGQYVPTPYPILASLCLSLGRVPSHPPVLLLRIAARVVGPPLSRALPRAVWCCCVFDIACCFLRVLASV